MVTLNFHVINYIQGGDNSCHITIDLAFVFILPKAKCPWWTHRSGLVRNRTQSYLTKIWVNHLGLHMIFSLL